MDYIGFKIKHNFAWKLCLVRSTLSLDWNREWKSTTIKRLNALIFTLILKFQFYFTIYKNRVRTIMFSLLEIIKLVKKLRLKIKNNFKTM